MSNARIRRLFFDKLKDGIREVDGSLKWMVMQDGVIHLDSKGVEINFNTTHLAVHLIPAPAETETLKGDHVRYSGIYQIDARILLDPKKDIRADSNIVLEEITDTLQSIFKVNLRLVDTSTVHVPETDENGDIIPYEDFAVQVISPIKVREARREGKTNWWHAHCYFDYRADTNI